MKTNRLPLTLELANPVQIVDLSDFDAKAQLSSKTSSTQKSSTLFLGAVDVTADIQADDVIA